MGSRMRNILFIILMLFVVSGCYNKQVRHLASDAALLKVGKSTQEDVLVFLGDPDEQEDLGNGSQKWRYLDQNRNLFEKTPWVGKHFGSPEYLQVVVTLKDGIVTECIYSSSDEDDMDWADDYSWQEKKQ